MGQGGGRHRFKQDPRCLRQMVLMPHFVKSGPRLSELGWAIESSGPSMVPKYHRCPWKLRKCSTYTGLLLGGLGHSKESAFTNAPLLIVKKPLLWSNPLLLRRKKVKLRKVKGFLGNTHFPLVCWNLFSEWKRCPMWAISAIIWILFTLEIFFWLLWPCYQSVRGSRLLPQITYPKWPKQGRILKLFWCC